MNAYDSNLRTSRPAAVQHDALGGSPAPTNPAHHPRSQFY